MNLWVKRRSRDVLSICEYLKDICPQKEKENKDQMNTRKNKITFRCVWLYQQFLSKFSLEKLYFNRYKI